MNTNASCRGRALASTGLCAMAALLSMASPAGSQCEPLFIRGDSNADGTVNISDGIATLSAFFLGEDQPSCLDAADANDSGVLDIEDPTATFAYLFGGGPEPPAPAPFACGKDPTSDALSCDA